MNEFELLVQEMRNAQKRYFDKREQYWLVQSKKLEKMVDDYLFNKTNPTLKGLFNNDKEF